ncbi:hypothetical protein GcM3_185032 [Golovinomyces cichoracearum]|uniref:Uncharacterized protein n=1 Tax=Golovinomyces cichoracearum TaxID=62708 RepID=A0A420HKG0_9PEZI|nr:hypothetical protein GcM3_185032 [Golovinomyces cichoracearum]
MVPFSQSNLTAEVAPLKDILIMKVSIKDPEDSKASPGGTIEEFSQNSCT